MENFTYFDSPIATPLSARESTSRRDKKSLGRREKEATRWRVRGEGGPSEEGSLRSEREYVGRPSLRFHERRVVLVLLDHFEPRRSLCSALRQGGRTPRECEAILFFRESGIDHV